MNYLLDILMPVYNHEQFLEQALQGVISQKTNFNYRLLIGEDCSTDNGKKIIEKYVQQYPNIIFPFYRQKNIGAHINSKLLFSEMTAKYVAICEGDDYWIDSNKLQKQIDLLENNQHFAMCFTNHETVNQTGKILNANSIASPFNKNLSHEDVLANNYFIGTATVIIRKDTLPNPFPTIYFEAANGDYLLYCLATRFGEVAFLDCNTAAYRLHDNGTWTSRNTEKKYWAMYRTFLVARQMFLTTSEKEALQVNLSKILKNLSWAYFELPKSEQLKFIFKSLFISIRFGVFKTWFSINSQNANLFLKNKFNI